MKNEQTTGVVTNGTDNKFWASNLVCDECCLPLEIYGENRIVGAVKYGKDRLTVRFFCDLHALEFEVSERQTARLYAAQRRAKLDERKAALV